MELEEINNMNIDPPKISENCKNRSFGEVTLEGELYQLVHSNTHRISGRKSRMMVEEGRDWTPRSEKVIDKFVKSYFPSFYDDYIITKKEIFNFWERTGSYCFTDKYHLGECCHYSLCMTLGLQDHHDLEGFNHNDPTSEELLKEDIIPEWKKRLSKEK